MTLGVLHVHEFLRVCCACETVVGCPLHLAALLHAQSQAVLPRAQQAQQEAH